MALVFVISLPVLVEIGIVSLDIVSALQRKNQHKHNKIGYVPIDEACVLLSASEKPDLSCKDNRCHYEN